MYGVRERMLLRHLVEVEGRTQSAAARELGIHRKTLQRWIADGLLDTELDVITARYGPRPPVPMKLDPVKPLIAERLAEYPRLSAKRLLAECRGAGYTGGYTLLCDHVRMLRPPPVPAPVVRFETPPGHQAQVDFAHCRFPWGMRYALIVVLGYSRLLWVRFYPRQDLRTLIQGLEACFAWWGGVPHELLFDQMKSVLTRDDRLTGGGLTHNLEFLRFTRHYEITARVCRPYRAQTKGKVERPIRYLRENFLYGRTFLSDADLNAQAEHWLATVANVRVHGTTQEVPLTRFESEERGVLRPLPLRAYHSPLLTPATPVRGVRLTHPTVDVEHRSLSVYAALAGGEG